MTAAFGPKAKLMHVRCYVGLRSRRERPGSWSLRQQAVPHRGSVEPPLISILSL
jgi:hypothetical protein